MSQQQTGRVTGLAFSKILGVQERAVRKAINAGRIIRGDDGLIDVESQIERWHATTVAGRRAAMPPKPPKEPKPLPEPKPRGRRRKEKPPKVPGKIGRPITGLKGEASEQRAQERDEEDNLKTQKLTVQIELLRENLAAAKRDTVNRADARRGINSFIRMMRDAWINFPNRFGAQIAAQIGADPKATMATLDAFVRDQLTEIANLDPPKELDAG